MEFPENLKNNGKSSEDMVLEMVQRRGVGHMPEGTPFSLNEINESDRSEVI